MDPGIPSFRSGRLPQPRLDQSNGSLGHRRTGHLESMRWAIRLLLGLTMAMTAHGAGDTITRLEVPLSLAQRKLIGGGRPAPISYCRVAYVLPPNFDATRSWPILIVSATSDPEFNSSIRHLEAYVEGAAAEGWVLLAADPPTVPAVGLDTNELRFALVSAALDELKRRWPDSASWPIALAGFSGGSKRSGWLAAMFAERGRMPIGVFQGGCNRATLVDAIKLYRPPRRAFREIPVFLSSGLRDTISTPGEHRAVERALRADGFSHVRLETYDGEHRMHRAHVAEALRWFRSSAPLQPAMNPRTQEQGRQRSPRTQKRARRYFFKPSTARWACVSLILIRSSSSASRPT